MSRSVDFSDLRSSLASTAPPLVIDVRRAPAFHAASDMIAGAIRRDPERAQDWAASLPGAPAIVVYCVHGHEVSQGVAAMLDERGTPAAYLRGGIEEGWKAKGGELERKPPGAGTRWITRERPKVDRIACPWLIARFIDAHAEFLYVPASEVADAAERRCAIPYDMPGVRFSHDGERCSFDAFLKRFNLTEPALVRLALIVRGADTDRPELAPQSAGLAAISIGLSRLIPDDREMLARGMVLYDALYAWCRDTGSEVHAWNPQALR
jgi:rhodanese-related sulfurtransferase